MYNDRRNFYFRPAGQLIKVTARGFVATHLLENRRFANAVIQWKGTTANYVASKKSCKVLERVFPLG
jgi:hypothetical protein